MRELAARHGIRLVGPNCMGVIETDPKVRLNASFAAAFPEPGNVAFASQSGALGEVLLAKARELDLGLSAFVSLGNKADVSGNDLLAWWGDDPRTRVILLYLEGLGNPTRFARLARRITRAGKPVLVVKSGRSEAGALATQSHTGSLAGGDEVLSTFLEQCGVLRVTRVEGLFNLARAFSRQPIPRGGRVAILTNAGGPGIMAADAAAFYGLSMATLSEQTQATLKGVLPPEASIRNPVDAIATASAQAYGACAAALLADPGVDGLLPIYVGPGNVDVAAVAVEVVRSIELARGVGAGQKPVLACFMGGRAGEAYETLRRAGIPAYDFPEDAAQALGAMARFRRWLDRAPGEAPALELQDERARALCDKAPTTSGGGWLPSDAAYDLLDAAGIPTAPRAFAKSADEAVTAAEALVESRGGWPIVVKLDHPDLIHKTEVAGVKLGLDSAQAVRRAADELLAGASAAGLAPERARLLVQRQVQGGKELILGSTRDPAVGPVVLVGLGGTLTEVLRDTQLRVPPLTDQDAKDMLNGLRGAKLLEGYRGATGADRPAIEQAILRLAALVEACPRILEVDVNPLLALPPGQGVVAVDVRVRLSDPA